jgi:hypothetical protein
MLKIFKNSSAILFYSLTSLISLPALANDVDFEVWKSALHYRIATQGRYDQLMELDFISRISEQNPDARYEDLIRLGGKLTRGNSVGGASVFPTSGQAQPIRLGQEPLEKSWSSAMKVATELPTQVGLAFKAVDFIKEWTEFQSNRYFDQIKPDNLDALIYGRERRTALENVYFSRDVVDAIGKRIQKSPVLSYLVATETGISPTSTAREILEIFPDFAQSREIRDIARQMETHRLNFAEIKGLLNREFVKLTSQFTAINTRLGEQDRTSLQQTLSQKLKADRLKSRIETQALIDDVNLTREEQKRALERTRESIYLLVKSLDWIGEHEFAKTVVKTSGAFLSIADSFSEFQRGIQLPSNAFQSALSGILFTGNILGAVQVLVGSIGPSFEDEVFSEFRNIRNQITASSVKISAQLSRLNENLAEVYSGLTRQISLLNRDVEILRGNVLGVAQSLTSLEVQLYNTESYLTAQNSDLGLRPLRASILSCLQSSASSNRLSTLADTESCFKTFASYASIHASDQVSTQPNNQDFSPATVIKNLKKSPVDLERSFTYLAEVAREKFSLFDLMPQIKKVNPLHWSMSSNAFYQYGLLNPLAQNPESLDSLKDLIAHGTHLELFIERLTNGVVQESVGINPVNESVKEPFLLYTLTEYKNSLDTLKDTTSRLKAGIEADHFKSYKLDGPVPQETVPGVLPAQLPRCATFEVSNASPEHVSQANGIPSNFTKPSHLESVVPTSLWMAQKLGLGTVSACVASIGTTELRKCSDADPSRFADRQCGKLEMVIHMKLGESQPTTWTLQSHEVEFWAQGHRGAWSKQRTYSEVLAEVMPVFQSHAASRVVTHPGLLSIIENSIRTVAESAKTRLAQAISIGAGVSENGANYEASVKTARMYATLLRSALFLSLGQSAQSDEFIRALLYSPKEKLGGADPLEVAERSSENTGGLYNSFVSLWEDEYEKLEFLRSYLTNKKNAGLLPEAHPWVRPTLLRLKSMERVLEQNSKPSFAVMIQAFWKVVQSCAVSQ